MPKTYAFPSAAQKRLGQPPAPGIGQAGFAAAKGHGDWKSRPAEF